MKTVNQEIPLVAAGLQKTSLIDYPSRISCVVFLSSCNFTCPYCHNPELALGKYPERIPMDQLLAFIGERRKFLDGVVITGGEPTLHAGLSGFCRAIRQLGLSVKIDTNGSHPEVVAALMQEKLIDYLAMDIKTALPDYGPPLCKQGSGDAIRQSIELIMAGTIDYEFRTTCVRPFVDTAIIEQIARTIKGARTYTLHTFQPNVLLQPDFFTQHDPGYPPDGMAELQTLAAPWVTRCLVK